MDAPVILALDSLGLKTAERAAGLLGGEVHGLAGRAEAAVQFDEVGEHLRALFAAGRPIIGVCAAGVLIRLLAPMLTDKWAEPPVVALSGDGASAVPLLGGHRGANALARKLAEGLGGHAAVTTAGDAGLGLTLDEPPPGWRLANPEHAKGVAAAALAGEGLGVGGEMAEAAPWLSGSADGARSLIATEKLDAPAPDRLIYHPQRHVLGVGCARGCPPADLAELAQAALAEADIAPGAVACVASIDVKADEPAVLALAERLGVPARFFDAATLEAEAPRLANPSEIVFQEVGCHGVAEGAALAGAGPDGALVIEKRKSAQATAALARAPKPITRPPGRPRGRVSVVGIGPGQAAWRTPEASKLIHEADELVGYGLYIDLLGPAAAGKPRRDFPLGGEEDRCRYALEAAGEGRDVALICSGDGGVYAMGTLVMELLARGDGPGGVSPAARRAQVVHAPGITALQAASARAGALIGHDFCAISLSDLLTPREDILKRLRAAAAGDFVVAFYNPVSKRRRTLLAEARDILLTGRPAETPVLLASNLGRPDERLLRRTLETLQVDEVDMLTVVLIGSSQSRAIETGDGWRLFTPRGYAKKLAERAPSEIP